MGRITPEVVQQVRDAIDIIDVAAQLTTLKKQGRKYVALCPFHKEKTPSFQIDPDLGLYHCFGCGAGGDAIKLHMETSGDDFRTAIEALAQRYAIPLPADDGGSRRPSLDLTGALEAALLFFSRQLSRVDMPRKYLDERQISPDLRQSFGLGYAPDGWHHLLDALRSKVEMKLLVAAGLVGISERTERPYDRFRHRLMFPIHSTSGRLVGFGGRTLGDDRAKYVNTSETEAFKKGSLLYGLHQAKRAIRDRGRAILVEGYFDVLAMAASGLPEAVAGMGTALTPEQAQLVSRFTDRVVLAYDGDDAGRAAADKALPILLAAGLA
ncbi:MAG: DNA primase, partial [Acidobacteriota bacterium]